MNDNAQTLTTEQSVSAKLVIARTDAQHFNWHGDIVWNIQKQDDGDSPISIIPNPERGDMIEVIAEGEGTALVQVKAQVSGLDGKVEELTAEAVITVTSAGQVEDEQEPEYTVTIEFGEPQIRPVNGASDTDA